MRKDVEPCHAPSNNIVSSGGTIRINGDGSGGGSSSGSSSGNSGGGGGVYVWSEEIEG